MSESYNDLMWREDVDELLWDKEFKSQIVTVIVVVNIVVREWIRSFHYSNMQQIVFIPICCS